MKRLMLFVLCFIAVNCFSQEKYYTKTGKAYFMSHTDLLDIDGINRQTISFFDVKSGEIVCAMLMKGFEFTLATAAEHFNETYMESHLFPKANFKGKIADYDKIDITKKGILNINVTGDLTIHGVTKTISLPAVVDIKEGSATGKCNFQVSINDYGIKLPAVVEDRVANIVDVQIELDFKPYQNQ